MLVSRIYKIASCNDNELNIARESLLKFRLTYNDNKKIEALLFIIAGGAEDMNSYVYVEDYAARNYNVATINVNYHCIGNRSHLGASFCIDELDKFILKSSLKAINLDFDTSSINSYESLNHSFLRLDYLLSYLKSKNYISQDYRLPAHVSFDPQEKSIKTLELCKHKIY